jgi:hypothetical protein
VTARSSKKTRDPGAARTFIVERTTDGRNCGARFDAVPAPGERIALEGGYEFEVQSVTPMGGGYVNVANANYVMIWRALDKQKE